MADPGKRIRSSVAHPHQRHGEDDELEGARWITRELWGRTLKDETERWADVGDSTNDQLMFRSFAGGTTALARTCFRSYINKVRITYDKAKREVTLNERGLDFNDAKHVFAGLTFEALDQRRDYGEKRIICFGLLKDRLVVVGYTPRGADRHVFSMRKANDREQARIGPILGL